MLQGLDVEENPLKQPTSENNGKLDVIYEDEYIAVINKPAGMLSVPGKDGKESVYSLARKLYPEANGPMIVHRLDMATSA